MGEREKGGGVDVTGKDVYQGMYHQFGGISNNYQKCAQALQHGCHDKITHVAK